MAFSIDLSVLGLKYKDLELETVAHNLANTSTYGYKEQSLAFSRKLDAAEKDPNLPEQAPSAKQIINFAPGPLMPTNNALHVGIQGEGFFEVTHGGEALYTRNGSFSLDSEGYLVTHNGDRVAGLNGDVQIKDPGPVSISSTGLVSVNGTEQGQIKISKIENPEDMKMRGGSLFALEGNSSASELETPRLVQGSLETSNTNPVTALVHMIEISRQHQMYEKFIQTQTKLDESAVNSLSKLS